MLKELRILIAEALMSCIVTILPASVEKDRFAKLVIAYIEAQPDFKPPVTKSTRLEELKEEYKKQDNRGTAYPFYVQVQELICVGVMHDCCPDVRQGETRIEFRHPDLDYGYCSEDKQALIDAIREYCHDEPRETFEQMVEEIEEYTIGYIWYPVEFFLTIKGAEQYMKDNKHNHGKLRTYISYFERRNYEMRDLLENLGFEHG